MNKQSNLTVEEQERRSKHLLGGASDAESAASLMEDLGHLEVGTHLYVTSKIEGRKDERVWVITGADEISGPFPTRSPRRKSFSKFGSDMEMLVSFPRTLVTIKFCTEPEWSVL